LLRLSQDGVDTHEAITEDSEPDRALEIRGSEGMMINYSRCCFPIPGDPILGILTTGNGLAVHRAQCPMMQKLQAHPGRCIHLRWSENMNADFLIGVGVECQDKPGVLAAVSLALAESGTNVQNITSRMPERGGQVRIIFHFTVKNRHHLAEVFRVLRKVRYVDRTYRVI